jgi:methyl-accepting chemotaxis protein
VHKLGEAASQIGDIINLINGIAGKTNLLALNAAVEAARAGEHGKGFAVVAEEVRNLAQRSAAAAKDTTVLIEDSTSKTESGTKLSEKCKDVLTGIVQNVKKVTELTKEIANASTEQSEGINQVANAVQQMDNITQQNASGAEEQAAASEELTAQAQFMQGQVKKLSEQVHGSNGNGTSNNHKGLMAGDATARLRGTLGDTVKRTRKVTGLSKDISGESGVIEYHDEFSEI